MGKACGHYVTSPVDPWVAAAAILRADIVIPGCYAAAMLDKGSEVVSRKGGGQRERRRLPCPKV